MPITVNLKVSRGRTQGPGLSKLMMEPVVGPSFAISVGALIATLAAWPIIRIYTKLANTTVMCATPRIPIDSQ